jgi:hypothetical protein
MYKFYTASYGGQVIEVMAGNMASAKVMAAQIFLTSTSRVTVRLSAMQDDDMA